MGSLRSLRRNPPVRTNKENLPRDVVSNLPWHLESKKQIRIALKENFLGLDFKVFARKYTIKTKNPNIQFTNRYVRIKWDKNRYYSWDNIFDCCSEVIGEVCDNLGYDYSNLMFHRYFREIKISESEEV